MGDERVFRKLDSLDRDAWAISSVVYAELHYGLAKGQLFERTATALEKFLFAAPVVSFDSHAAREAACVRAELEKLGKPSGAIDPLIAGHARYLGATLVTSNTKHFENVPGLRLENWR
jgi:tRNA(fMet)-specific endonuclease VapC